MNTAAMVINKAGKLPDHTALGVMVKTMARYQINRVEIEELGDKKVRVLFHTPDATVCWTLDTEESHRERKR